MDTTWQNASQLNRPVSPETIQLLAAAGNGLRIAGRPVQRDDPPAGPDVPPEGGDSSRGARNHGVPEPIPVANAVTTGPPELGKQ
jgi:hypothetical protein